MPTLSRMRRVMVAGVRGALALLPYKGVNVLLEAAQQSAAAKGPEFITLHRRAKSGATVPWTALTPPVPREPPLKCALVLQGPLRHEDAFTLESVRYYTHTLPGSTLIVSTWENEPHAALHALRQLGAEVVVCTPPNSSGSMNVNRQASILPWETSTGPLARAN